MFGGVIPDFLHMSNDSFLFAEIGTNELYMDFLP